uniref:Uncharacterized protein n=1 Tax=Amphimedon queenslandica TaxID=400682 RepID=A0A1X7TAY2_AMPQE
MYTLSAFNSSLIVLVNIYTDEFNNWQDTRVYANDAMQVSIFVSVNYNGDTDEGILDQIKGYVQENVVIYTLDDGKVILDTSKWKKSKEGNSFHHDIDHAGNSIPGTVSDIRAPLYFTVPVGSEGEHRWIAKLDEKETSTSTPVTITVQKFSATSGDVEIVNKAATPCNQMRALKYKDGVFPDVQKLVKLVDYKGIKFLSSADKAWVSMIHSSKGHKMGVFVEYKQTQKIRVAKPGHEYFPHEMIKKDLGGSGDRNILHCGCCDDSLDFTLAEVEEVWNEGIAMLMAHHSSLEMIKYYSSLAVSTNYNNFEMNDFLIEDNFGNRMTCHINWNKDSGWWGNWAVSTITVVYP